MHTMGIIPKQDMYNVVKIKKIIVVQ